MTQDEERQDGEEQAPEQEQPAAEQEQPAAEQEQPAAEQEQPAAEQEQPAAEQEQPAADAGDEAAGGEAETETEKKKEGDQPPGAELEPIAIETERPLSAEEKARVEAEAEERARLEAEATAETGEEPSSHAGPTVKLESDARFSATGKRKSSIARVIVLPGNGRLEVNKRSLEEYFPRPLHQTIARQPLVTAGYESSVDIRVRVHGGGISGQAGAVRHGIARALCEIDPELRRELKRRGFLTRDARRKERRKAGLKKARKRPQFSKR